MTRTLAASLSILLGGTLFNSHVEAGSHGGHVGKTVQLDSVISLSTTEFRGAMREALTKGTVTRPEADYKVTTKDSMLLNKKIDVVNLATDKKLVIVEKGD
ncbi:hypothetical protein [Pseudobacteriovorax antillogorgiicola]|uniref:Uncharacterized protein n=1 Tax=Pseudobacteriovorax antillogorgiicola TaxID=1513793 RepID=A0A1Y6B9C6_9BACT|nr:hypothetical protein [Pseudobacteriovorax antillogorgiicola]TCS58497.1 hypothetical protein EDD56_10210 [Pseudobacteriovorax antillogorgiicola]SME98227.1 hypothetical protein SAMN06296036_102433 [Pseudobacteriovorax antillogorgiicola]